MNYCKVPYGFGIMFQWSEGRWPRSLRRPTLRWSDWDQSWHFRWLNVLLSVSVLRNRKWTETSEVQP